MFKLKRDARSKRCLHIGVMALSEAVGCTSTAISAAIYLRHIVGGRVAIIEDTDRVCFRQIAKLAESSNVTNYSHTFKKLDFFYDEYSIEESDKGRQIYDYIVTDYGKWNDDVLYKVSICEFVIIVASLQSFKRAETISFFELKKEYVDRYLRSKAVFLVQGAKKDINSLLVYGDVSVFPMPYISDSTMLNDELVEIYEKII